MKHLILIVCVVMSFGCTEKNKYMRSFLDKEAEKYVVLALNLGMNDGNYVDAYFGADSIRLKAEKMKLTVDSVYEQAKIELNRLYQMRDNYDEEMGYRRNNLIKLYKSMIARAGFLKGEKISFAEECKLVYDVDLPNYSIEHYDSVLAALENSIPGKGTLQERYIAYRDRFEIPKDKIDTVFKTAINEARKITKTFIDMPEGEHFAVEYVKGKPWGAYNWFKGNSFSLIQVNTEPKIYIDRAIDLACHEGYPGHHVFHSHIEQNLLKKLGYVEYSVYALFSPLSVISEGAANFGINVAFPPNERLKFEKEVLFPLAGFNPADADLYFKILELKKELQFVSIIAAQKYLDGKISRDETIAMLMKYDLRNRETAARNIDFFNTYRAYIINYSLGEKLVGDYITSKAGIDLGKQRAEFSKLISRPIMPSSLK